MTQTIDLVQLAYTHANYSYHGVHEFDDDGLQKFVHALMSTSEEELSALRERVAELEAKAQGVPDGFMIAPVTPTIEWCADFMGIALRNAEFKKGSVFTSDDVVIGYQIAMRKQAEREAATRAEAVPAPDARDAE